MSRVISQKANQWPKKQTTWIQDRVFYVSIPFTWNLPTVRTLLLQRSIFWDSAIVGGPAVELIPGFFADIDYVSEGHNMPGVLQMINPMSTRTTLGCIRRCKFCAIGTGQIEGKFKELADWPDLPVICDNNLLAASQEHFDRVINRLIVWKWADFNQGLDSRLLTEHHAKRIAEIKKPICRLALDHMDYHLAWQQAFDRLRNAGIAKSNIHSYCLIGYNSDPRECWQRCEWVEGHGVKAYPMWYHRLDQLEKNIVTQSQSEFGWNEYERKRIMGWYYQHRGTKGIT